MTKIYAYKGEKITCEKGHIICEAAIDIMYGSVPSGKELKKWKQEEPKIGSDIPVCKRCGSEFYRNNETGIHMHFKDGWR